MCAQTKRKESNSFKATVAELELYSGHIEDLLSGFYLDPKNCNLCTLLFEEISKLLKRRLPESNTVKVRVGRRSRILSIHMAVSAEEDVLKIKDDHSGDDDSQVEEAIGEMLLDKNSLPLSGVIERSGWSATISRIQAPTAAEVLDSALRHRRNLLFQIGHHSIGHPKAIGAAT